MKLGAALRVSVVFLLVIFNGYSLQTHLGFRAGWGVNSNIVLIPQDIMLKDTHIYFVTPSTGSVYIGTFVDLKFLDSFSLSSSINFYINRGAGVRIRDYDSISSTLHVKYHAFDVDLLVKGYLGIWYAGVGVGFNINFGSQFLAARKRNKEEKEESRSVRLPALYATNIVLETGLHIPLDENKKHHFSVSLRNVANISGMGLMFSMMENKSLKEKIKDKVGVITPFSSSLNIGYVYSF